MTKPPETCVRAQLPNDDLVSGGAGGSIYIGEASWLPVRTYVAAQQFGEFICTGGYTSGERCDREAPEVEIRGRFIDAIDPEHTVELPKTYRAQIRRTTKTYFSTEEEETTYLVLSLRPV